MRARLECEHSESAAQRFVDYWSGAGAWLALPASRRVAVAARMPSVLHHFDALFREPAQHVQLMTLVMPMLVMSGAKTVSATRRVGELLRTLLPHARHDVLPDMGHMGPLTHAAQVNQRIVQFLHGVMSSSGTRANNNAAAAAASLG
jgi:pimeloyl-ACP methyl ester carboxylesterase